MPYVKCRACKSYAGKALAYITDEKAERIYTHALDQSRSLSKQFIETAKVYGKGETYDERKYYHIKISFEPKDRIENGGKLDYEMAENISNEFLQETYSGFEYVLAIHSDTKHVHAHAIINAVSFENGKKIQHSNNNLAYMKDRVNELAGKYGISMYDWRKAVKQKRERDKAYVPTEKKEISRGEQYIKDRYGDAWAKYSWKETLRICIDDAKLNCKSRSEFQDYLKNNYDIEMPRNTENTVSFIHPAVGKPIRGNKLGTDYMSEEIDKALNKNYDNHAERPAEQKNVDISSLKNLHVSLDRNDVSREAKAAELVKTIESGACKNQQIEELILELHQQLESVSGNNVYENIPNDVKETVNDIVKELAADEHISELYELWYAFEFENLKNYKDEIPDFVPLDQQKEFTSIKDTIINAAKDIDVSNIMVTDTVFSLFTNVSKIISNNMTDNMDLQNS
ncbi:MAG: relaxase/mobilization nuclease domain-containing protein, partial [Eubacteriales bacterium]|nr:relaxase/mobilization nuclease domain-containing protein [Eubacteriales bacterium]